MKTNLRNPSLPGLVLMALFLLALLAACSGGTIDVSINGTTLPPGTIPPFQDSEPVTAQGVITGFGDVTVKGVEYAVGNASIFIDGEAAALSDLEMGHVVTVTGRYRAGWMAGTADTIRAYSRVIGPLEVIDAGNGLLRVMGQPVRLRPDTQFSAGIDPDTLDGLTIGDTVRISGYADAAGGIRATRIEHTGTPLQLIGKVAGLDIGNLMFDINQLTVDYGNAVLIDLPGGAPQDGMPVRATGTLANGMFMVEQLVAAPAFTGSSGRRAQIAGVITRYASLGDFSVNDADIGVRQWRQW